MIRSFVAALLLVCPPGCSKKSETTITADPSAKSAPSAVPKSDAASVYAVVLHDHLAPFVRGKSDRIAILDDLVGQPCGRPDQLASSLPTARTDTLEAWAHLRAGLRIERFATPLLVDFIPLDAMPHGADGGPAWPGGGVVGLTGVAFDGTRDDALVGLRHWQTPTSPVTSYVIHLVRREGTWFEQELLRCP